MRTATNLWWRHLECPHSGHECLTEWKTMWHDLPFWQAVAVVFGVFVFMLLLIGLWLQPYLLPETSLPSVFTQPWQRGWPYPMW